MRRELYTTTERAIIICRAAGLKTKQIADKLRLRYDQVNDMNKVIHRKVKRSYQNEKVTGIMVLGIAVAKGEITKSDLKILYASLGIDLNNLP